MPDWKKNAVNVDTSMRDVMTIIDESGVQIALVVADDNCHLLGVATDGDIRRSILKGNALDTPVSNFMNQHAITGLADEDRKNWQRTMRRHVLLHLPILDADGCVSDLARVDAPEEPQRENIVVLMAGGLGTRLRPLTKAKPKPLLKIGHQPILATIIENFVEQGFYKFKLCINYHGDLIKEYCHDGSQWGAEIEYIEEGKRLGTAGALSLLSDRPEKPFFVMNADLLAKVDFVRLLDFHKKQNNLATMCVREYRYQVPYGVVQLDKHKIIHLKEKPIQFFNVNAGVYLLDPSIIEHIPKNDYFDMTSLFDHLIKNNQHVGSFPLREYWMDIGRMEDYEQADMDYTEQFDDQ